MTQWQIGDKFTIVPPNNHLVDTVTKVTDTEIWGTVCSWNIRDCIKLDPNQAEYMEEQERKKYLFKQKKTNTLLNRVLSYIGIKGSVKCP
jgi:hypothetical protein